MEKDETNTAGVAEVLVDRATGKIKVHNIWAAIRAVRRLYPLSLSAELRECDCRVEAAKATSEAERARLLAEAESWGRHQGPGRRPREHRARRRGDLRDVRLIGARCHHEPCNVIRCRRLGLRATRTAARLHVGRGSGPALLPSTWETTAPPMIACPGAPLGPQRRSANSQLQ